MEISPVANVSITSMARSKSTDLGMADVYDIERSSRIGDETYSPSGEKAGTGSESDEDTQDTEDTYGDHEDEEDEIEPKTPPVTDSQINFIA